MGSEMCIRDRGRGGADAGRVGLAHVPHGDAAEHPLGASVWRPACLLYTSDAADERSSVDLGGRRILKKKKTS